MKSLFALLVFLALTAATPAARQLREIPDYDVNALNKSDQVVFQLKPGKWDETWNNCRSAAEDVGYRVVMYNFKEWQLTMFRSPEIGPLTAEQWKKLRAHPFVMGIKPKTID